jgi:hypothetical protein
MEIVENLEQWQSDFHQGWLAHYQRTGKPNWEIYNRPQNSQAPSGPGIELAKSRLALISSAGAYLAQSEERFDDEDDLGDYTIRRFPSTTPFEALAYAHTHYDHAAVNEDPQVLLPLRHLEDMVKEGLIGELALSVISFCGYQPDIGRVVNETIPAIVEMAKAEEIDAALLVPA